ncbi:MAG TPA: SDR family NAD(P)-dependent oxidoreductase, partial [Alphaproteobacteria bacterium]|nr:SDR family NAD(P)-dependent oxidoreductase [Alphaproteobacteria bacterium]
MYPKYMPECVMITGATGGFGQAFAARFAAAGCKLVLHGRSLEKLDAIAEKLNVPVHKLVFDLKDKQATIE